MNDIKRKTCKCETKINAALKEFNTCLSKTLTLNFTTGNSKSYISIATEKIDTKKRGTAKKLLAT